MRFAPSDEQRELQRSVRGFLSRRVPPSATRARIEADRAPFDPATWRSFTEELGVHALLLPEDRGGVGGSFVDVTFVLSEMGRGLYPGPFLATTMAGSLLSHVDHPDAARYIEQLVEGAAIAALPLLVPGSGESGLSVRYGSEGRDSVELDGQLPRVLDSEAADFFVLATRMGDAPAIVVADADVTRRERRDSLDPTRPLGSVTFEATPGRVVATGEAAEQLATRSAQLATVAVAADQLGVAEACLDLSVDYAKTRYQFGRPIGSFQAVKHRCADMFMGVEAARSAVQYAAWIGATEPDGLASAAAVAALSATSAANFAADSCVQIHGGIGFTWEHDAHLYVKRAKASDLLHGSHRRYTESLAATLLDRDPELHADREAAR